MLFEIIISFVILILLVLLISSGIIINRLIKKIDIYEEWIYSTKVDIIKLNKDIKTVDDKNLFEKDDDVGFVFSEIVRLIKEFNDRVI